MRVFTKKEKAVAAWEEYPYLAPFLSCNIDATGRCRHILPESGVTREEAFEQCAKTILERRTPYYGEYYKKCHIVVDVDYPSNEELKTAVGGNTWEWTMRLCDYVKTNICDLVVSDPPITPCQIETLVLDSSSDKPGGKFSKHLIFKLPGNKLLDSACTVGTLIGHINDKMIAEYEENKNLPMLPNGKSPFDMQIYPTNPNKTRLMRCIGSTKITPNPADARYLFPEVDGVKLDHLDVKTVLKYMITYIPENPEIVTLKCAGRTNKRSFCSSNTTEFSKKHVGSMPMPAAVRDLVTLLNEKDCVSFDPDTGFFIISGSRFDCPFDPRAKTNGVRYQGDTPHPRYSHLHNHIMWCGVLGPNGYIDEKCHNTECRKESKRLFLKDIDHELVQKARSFVLEEPNVDIGHWI